MKQAWPQVPGARQYEVLARGGEHLRAATETDIAAWSRRSAHSEYCADPACPSRLVYLESFPTPEAFQVWLTRKQQHAHR